MIKTQSAIELARVPTIPGLAFLPFRGEADFPAMVDIANRCNAADQVEDVETVENISNFVKYFCKDASREIVIVEVNGEMIGWGRVWFRVEDEGNWFHYLGGYVAPEWRRKGIGRALLRYQEELLREFARENQTPAPRFFQAFTATLRVGKVALFKSEGYDTVRHFYEMVRPHLDDLPEVRLPMGLELRPVESAHYRAIWDALNEAFRDHWGSFQPTEAHYQMWLNNPNFDPTLWQVAWDGDQVAGSAINAFDRARWEKSGQSVGVVDQLSVRRPWRQRGLGRALLAASFHVFHGRGLTQSLLGVDAENPNGALGLYESVGYQIAHTEMVLRKPMDEEG